jgi:hypothetical protein
LLKLKANNKRGSHPNPEEIEEFDDMFDEGEESQSHIFKDGPDSHLLEDFQILTNSSMD